MSRGPEREELVWEAIEARLLSVEHSCEGNCSWEGWPSLLSDNS